jgi:hypothetical protein
MRHRDFDLNALYVALDAQRKARGLSWAAATREINGHYQDIPRSRPIALSTITGLRTKKVGEGDGILQMLAWLGRPPESFVPGMAWHSERAALRKPADKRLRFDTRAMYYALNAQRLTRQLSWEQVADEIGVSKGSLLFLAKGGRTGFPKVMRFVEWIGQPVAAFTRVSDW